MSVNVKINYNGTTIDTLTESSQITYATENKYLEHDLNIDFTGTDDATATADDILAGKTAYISDGSKATGTIATKTAADLTILNDTVTVPKGYYAEVASKSVTAGTLGAITVVKSVVADNTMTITPQMATGIAGYNTMSETLGTPTTVSSSDFTADATADASKILSGYTAYIANGTKATGTITTYDGSYTPI